MAWLSGFDYRKKITITAATDAGTNYQVKFLIGKASGATGEDFDLGGHCLDTFADIRFTSSDEETELKYWIEKVETSGTSKLATVWVKVSADLSTSDQDIYCYYGKADATTTSDGENTFLLFDDFDGTSLDTTNRWDIILEDDISVGDGKLRMSSHDSNYTQIQSKDSYGYNVALRVYKLDSACNTVYYYNRITFGAGSEDLIYYVTTYVNAPTKFYNEYKKAGSSSGVVYQSNHGLSSYPQAFVAEMKRFDGKVVNLVNDSVTATYTNTTYLPTVSLNCNFQCASHNISTSLWYDIYWTLVRKCVETEPDFSSAGSEETVSSGGHFMTSNKFW